MITEIKSFRHYEQHIQTEYIVGNCGIDLEGFGEPRDNFEFKVDFNSKLFIDLKKLNKK